MHLSGPAGPPFRTPPLRIPPVHLLIDHYGSQQRFAWDGVPYTFGEYHEYYACHAYEIWSEAPVCPPLLPISLREIEVDIVEPDLGSYNGTVSDDEELRCDIVKFAHCDVHDFNGNSIFRFAIDMSTSIRDAHIRLADVSLTWLGAVILHGHRILSETEGKWSELKLLELLTTSDPYAVLILTALRTPSE